MIKVNFTRDFYYLHINKVDDFSRKFLMMTKNTNGQREFLTLANAQNFAFKNLTYSIDDIDFTSNLNTHILPSETLKFLASHGYTLNVNTNTIIKISDLNQVFNFSQHETSCFGLPQIFAKSKNGRVISACGSLGRDGLFTGVVEFEAI